MPSLCKRRFNDSGFFVLGLGRRGSTNGVGDHSMDWNSVTWFDQEHAPISRTAEVFHSLRLAAVLLFQQQRTSDPPFILVP